MLCVNQLNCCNLVAISPKLVQIKKSLPIKQLVNSTMLQMTFNLLWTIIITWLTITNEDLWINTNTSIFENDDDLVFKKSTLKRAVYDVYTTLNTMLKHGAFFLVNSHNELFIKQIWNCLRNEGVTNFSKTCEYEDVVRKTPITKAVATKA